MQYILFYFILYRLLSMILKLFGEVKGFRNWESRGKYNLGGKIPLGYWRELSNRTADHHRFTSLFRSFRPILPPPLPALENGRKHGHRCAPQRKDIAASKHSSGSFFDAVHRASLLLSFCFSLPTLPLSYSPQPPSSHIHHAPPAWEIINAKG